MTGQRELAEAFRPLEERDFANVAALARTIWLAHYTALITAEQIEYMLGNRFAPENLRHYLPRDGRWMDVLEVDSKLAGYCSYALADADGEMKLEQLYLLQKFHGIGLGGRMLAHVEGCSLALGARTVILQVNKRNDKATKLYRGAGYGLRQEVVVDIGRGYVMDDYVMEKQLVL